MAWCPMCGSEYRDQILRCPTCGVALTEEMPPDTAPLQSQPPLEPALLASFRDRMELGMARELLARNGVACFTREPGSGGYLLIVFGVSMFGTELYVERRDLARARALLASVDGAETPDFGEEQLELAYAAFMAQSPETEQELSAPREGDVAYKLAWQLPLAAVGFCVLLWLLLR